MSMHKIPLTDVEESGLLAHGLDIGTPSQLSDAFRLGVRWAIKDRAMQSERHALQAEGLHPAPCARYCEAQSFQIEIRGLEAEITRLRTQPAAQPERKLMTDERVEDLIANTKTQALDAYISGIYGHPVPRSSWATEAQPERNPASVDQIEDLRGEANRGYGIEKEDYFKAFRDAEAFHGITGDKKGSAA